MLGFDALHDFTEFVSVDFKPLAFILARSRRKMGREETHFVTTGETEEHLIEGGERSLPLPPLLVAERLILWDDQSLFLYRIETKGANEPRRDVQDLNEVREKLELLLVCILDLSSLGEIGDFSERRGEDTHNSVFFRVELHCCS